MVLLMIMRLLLLLLVITMIRTMTMVMAKMMMIARMMMVHIVWNGIDDDGDYDDNDGKDGDDDDDGIHCVGGGDREEGCCVTGRYPEGPTPTQRRPMIFILYFSGPKPIPYNPESILREMEDNGKIDILKLAALYCYLIQLQLMYTSHL